MQSLIRARTASRVTKIAVQKRYATSPSSNQGATTKSSGALPVVAAIGAVVGGIMLFNYSKTGRPDSIGKAMAKAGTPAQRSGGLGKMNSEDHVITTGEKTS